MSCPSTDSSALTVTYQMRVDGSANSISSAYTYSVSMSDGQRTSDPVTASVTITQQSNYDECLTLTLDTDELSSFSDNTLSLQYLQTNPETIGVAVETFCDNVNIQT
mmetsp:Transcript_21947/g.16298  ORF Transcript_21947/g.16298 Transcript_21947/m.16298 type:complete len:107 (+) Transcript_21947:980-1300(+)